MSIGENIKRYREIKNLTQKDLSEKSGITRESIGNYERGDRIPPSDILKSISIALGTTAGSLLDEENIDKKSIVGDNIKKYRVLKNLSQKDFAKLLEIPISTLANYENNHREPSIKELIEIAFALGVELNELCGEKPNELSLGEKIKLYRLKNKLTQKQLAEMCDISEIAIRSYENDTRNPKIEALEKISKALNMPINKEIKYKELKDYTIDELLAEIKRRVGDE